MGNKKTVKFNESDIKNLPDNRPALYKILTENNKNNYTGIAKRGRVQDRIIEHLGEIPGSKVQIEQMPNITQTEKMN